MRVPRSRRVLWIGRCPAGERGVGVGIFTWQAMTRATHIKNGWVGSGVAFWEGDVERTAAPRRPGLGDNGAPRPAEALEGRGEIHRGRSPRGAMAPRGLG